MQRAVLVVVSVALSAGCEGGACDEHTMAVAYAEEVPGGDSAETLLMKVGGEWQGVLQWRDGAGNPYGDTPVTFALAYMGGEVSFVDRTPDGAEGERLACVDEVVIPARFTLETGDRLLQGAWDVEVRHEIGDEGALSVQIEPFTGWDGEFSASLGAGSMWMHEELRLDAFFGEESAGGTITLTGRNVEGDMIFLIVAQWTAMRP